MDVTRSASQGTYYHLFAPLTGNKEGSKRLMVLRVKPKPTRFPTNGLYTPIDNTPLHSIRKWKRRAQQALRTSLYCSIN